MGTLARNQNVAQASRSLTVLSARIPYGRQGLASEWRSDLAAFNRADPGSGVAVRTELVRDLYQDVFRGVQSHAFRVTGRGSEIFHRPVPGTPPPVTLSRDSVRLSNLTGFAITVTARLQSATPRQPITMTIRAGEIKAFDFQSSTNAFISVRVARADGGQVPPPREITLNRPISGYNGALTTVSVFAQRFSFGMG